LEQDNDFGKTPSFAHVSGNVYVMAYQGPSNRGFIKTFTLADNGTITQIAGDEHDDSQGMYNSIVKVTGTIYALAYSGSGSAGYIKTFNISNDGSDMEALGQAIHQSSGTAYNSLVVADENTIVLAYQGPNTDGFIKTFTVSANGADITQVSAVEHAGSQGRYNSLIKMDGDTYLLAFAGPSDDGFLKTFTIPDDGSSITTAASLEHNTSHGIWNSVVQVDYNTYALAYYGYDTNDEYGLIQTFTIPLDGSTITEVASQKFATTANYGTYNSFIKLNSDEYALAYRGDGDDGYVKTFTISADGETITELWSLEHDQERAHWNELIQIDKNTFALAYTDSYDDGWIKTFDIASGDVTGPGISYATIAYDNSTVTIGLNEAAYNTNANSGSLEASDFALSISGGAATLTSATPTSIALSTNNTYTLGVSLTGIANGSEVLTISPVANAVYDANGTASSTSQSNNTVNLNEKVLPTITASSMASDNTTVNVTMSEAVYAAYSSGTASGDLAMSDFVLAVSGGEATLNSATPSSILGPGSFTSIGTYDGHTYYRSNSSANWADAKTICENAGGYLAVITTAAENTLSIQTWG